MSLMANGSIEYNPPKDKMGYTVTILVDDPSSWIVPWASMLKDKLSPFHNTKLCFSKEDICYGDFAFLLGCIQIVPRNFLKNHKFNIVAHESALPLGRGWSPLSWQVLEGGNIIPIVLFDAREGLDSGPIYMQDIIKLNGNELLDEIKRKQGLKTIELFCRFLERWPDLVPIEQKGNPTFYPKRNIEDDKIDEHKTIAENFNHLRIVDNEEYPAWFQYKGRKYTIKIYPYD
jgi:methionyl-tRNA formyltransferase